MRVHVDLAEELDVAEWSARHARGEVPDVVPYGLDKLSAHGIAAEFRRPLHGRTADFARKVRGRTRQMDFVSSAGWAMRRARRTADAALCWDERTGVPAALVPGGPPVASGAVWLDDKAALPGPLRVVTGRALHRMGAVFSCCEPTRAAVEQEWRLPTGRVHRFTMGVDEQFYRPLPAPERPGVVVSVGDDRRRDHAQLVRVMEQVGQSGVDARLELATTQRHVEVPEHVGVVHRRRMEGTILDLYGRSSVVAIALKRCTGVFGITVALEAMACARPVVITANAGLEEYIEDGVTGLLVPPGDDRAFRDAVASLLTDPEAAAEMGRAGRRAVEERFTTGHTAADLAVILRATS
ncbi:MAG: glycosyltransferase family 4 protein [Pseudonocardia sp.]|nr:glycosyltransferase family 4 protein [Pseudonocardia sp.]